jgi:DNA (cytosine-5)-methyltransferase 1
MKEINQLDLFSGIGGFHLGFERAGFKVNSYFSEVDKHAVAVYKHQFKDSTYVGSVTDVRGADLPRIDLITFGSPCQDFSLAGKRKGMGGERSSLITEAIRLVHECRPRVFIWENVKGTFSSNNGADFWAIIQAFANIGGYRLEWQLLNTSWFLPQNRERIYLVGYSTTTNGDWGGVFPIGETRRGNAHTSPIKVFDGQNHKWRSDNNTGTLTRMSGDAYRGQFVEAKYNYKKVNETIEQNPTAFKKGEARMMDLHNRKVQDISPCLVEPHHNASAVYDGRPKMIGYTRDAKGKVTDRHLKDTAGTIHASSGQGGNTDQFVQDYRIRRLTPIECERLQGFPDNHTSKGIYDGEVKEMSNTQRYKQCGNAVTVDVVQAIANKLHPMFEK